MNKNEALAALRTIAESEESDPAELISDYCDGMEFLDSEIAELLGIITGESNQEFADITATLEFLDEIDPEFARKFAEYNELCCIHYCDLDNCRDEH